MLRLPDMLALYGPNEYEILLASTPPEVAEQMASELDAALAAAGAIVRTGLATLPARRAHARGARRGGVAPRARRRASERGAAGASGGIVYDAVMERVHKLAERAAAGTINVLILGETGVGKEVLAERVHRMSPRAEKAFLCLNCAALSEHLLESELFGHERGAFTGATEAKPGLLETAPGGTVFLDEIGEMPLLLQAKLLRVLEKRHVTRVGGLKPKAIDVRFVAATNRDLEEEVARRTLPPGPLLPPQRHDAAHPAAARAARRDRAARRASSCGSSRSRSAGPRPSSRDEARLCSRPTRGRATCASCAT